MKQIDKDKLKIMTHDEHIEIKEKYASIVVWELFNVYTIFLSRKDSCPKYRRSFTVGHEEDMIRYIDNTLRIAKSAYDEIN